MFKRPHEQRLRQFAAFVSAEKNLPPLACMCLNGGSINSSSSDSCFDEDSRVSGVCLRKEPAFHKGCVQEPPPGRYETPTPKVLHPLQLRLGQSRIKKRV